MIKNVKVMLAVLAVTTCLSTGVRAENLVKNGGFETLTNDAGQLGFNTDATGWTTTGYNFVFTPGSADNGGVTGSFGNLQLWGPHNGSANGLPATSPDGGNFIAADGAFQVGPIQQTISGLTVGQKYAVSFDWAGAQQSGFTGPTTEQWQVSLGGNSQSTPILDNVNHGFTGWQHETFTYTATSSSEVLSFLAHGTPSGEPPFSLLDGVSLKAVPEGSTAATMFIGAIVLLAFIRRARASRAS